MSRQKRRVIAGLVIIVLITVIGRVLTNPRNQDFMTWGGGNSAERAKLVTIQQEPCPNAPFILPTSGWIGLFYGDPRPPYAIWRKHQGIDLFSDAPIGTVPVYAAYDGYITREEGWTSTLIQRLPQDPLNPSRQIWLYYTHLADEAGNDFIEDAFPRGTSELFVTQGTRLGYIGNYDGNIPSQIWAHLHFSIVQDDGWGRYLSELEFANTIDPTDYFGMTLHYDSGAKGTIQCR